MKTETPFHCIGLPVIALVVFAGCGEGTPPLLEESSSPGLHGDLSGLSSCTGKREGPARGLIRLLNPSDSSVVMEAVVAGSFELDVPAGIYQLEVAAFGAYPDRSFGALEFDDTLGYQLNGAYETGHVPHLLTVLFEETASEARATEILRNEGAFPQDRFEFGFFQAAVDDETHATYTAEALEENYPDEVIDATPDVVLCEL